MTRASATERAIARAATSDRATAALTDEGPGRAGEFDLQDSVAILERVEARTAARQPVLDVIASQVSARALEVVSWTVDRGWPMGRVREAWAVWRHGPLAVAQHSAALLAGRLEPDHAAALRCAGEEYERYAPARPLAYPAGALGALAQIAMRAAEHDQTPVTLHYAIRELQQLVRRMRACATADDPDRLAAMIARARRRLYPPPTPAAGPCIDFRITPPGSTGRWPQWAQLGDDGLPMLEHGELVLVASIATPERGDPRYLQTLRDAHLMRGCWPPAHTDGRGILADQCDRDEHDQRRARPGPYLPPADRRERAPYDDVELARLSGLALADVARIDDARRRALLTDLRSQQVARQRQSQSEFDAALERAVLAGDQLR